MKIVHFIDSGGLYGAEKILIALASEQIAAGHDVTVCSIGGPGEEKALDAELRRVGVPCDEVRFRSGFNLAGVQRINAYVSHAKPDIVHSHGYKADVLIALASVRSRFPKWVVTVHGVTDTRFLTKSWVYHLLDWYAILKADAVVSVSRILFDSYGSRRKPARQMATLIPNGIAVPEPPESVVPVSNALLQRFLDDNAAMRVLGVVARFSHEKGLDLIVDAFSRLFKDDGRYRLVIVGEGDGHGECQRLVEAAALGAYVCMPGYISDVRNLLGQLSALVIPSRSEGLPVVLLEAMAARVAVISTRVGEIPHVLENGACGTLAGSIDPQGLVVAVKDHFENEDAVRRKIDRAFERLTEHYTSAAMAEKYLALYKSLRG